MKKRLITTIIIMLLLFPLFSQGTEEVKQDFLKNFQQSIIDLPAPPDKGNSVVPDITGIEIIQGNTSSSGNARIEQDMSALTRLYKLVEKSYLYDIDYNAVYNAMAKAMFEALDDPYSEFIPAEDTATFEEETNGVYGGLGIVFTKPEEYCQIEQVYANTPAAKVGLAAKDKITHINGEPVDELTSTECANRMKGPVGETVTLTILRNTTSFDLTISRARISVPVIDYTMIGDDVGYLFISAFHSSTPYEACEALIELTDKGMKKLIIDLRDCPGGDVDACLSIADMFISDSELIKVSYKDESQNVIYWANKSVVISPDVEIVVLVNGGTASSAEILSSTLKDNNRATVIGSTTYGKGIMQIVTSFGDAEYKLTTASYLPPSGQEIHKVGITPDIIVEDVTVEEDEVDAYLELYNSDLIPAFVEEHPEFTLENVNLFVELHPEIQLRPIVIKLLVRNQYYLNFDYADQPIVDTMFDTCVIKALEILNN